MIAIRLQNSKWKDRRALFSGPLLDLMTGSDTVKSMWIQSIVDECDYTYTGSDHRAYQILPACDLPGRPIGTI